MDNLEDFNYLILQWMSKFFKTPKQSKSKRLVHQIEKKVSLIIVLSVVECFFFFGGGL